MVTLLSFQRGLACFLRSQAPRGHTVWVLKMVDFEFLLLAPGKEVYWERGEGEKGGGGRGEGRGESEEEGERGEGRGRGRRREKERLV